MRFNIATGYDTPVLLPPEYPGLLSRIPAEEATDLAIIHYLELDCKT
jgi:hypothetical protein